MTAPASGYDIINIAVSPSYPWVVCNTELPYSLQPGNNTLPCKASPPPSLEGTFSVPVTVTLEDAFGNIIQEQATLIFAVQAVAQGPLSDYAVWVVLGLIALAIFGSASKGKKKS